MSQFENNYSKYATSLPSLLATLRERNILCVGDVMLDEEVECPDRRASTEAPVLVVNEGERGYRAGGAANVAANLAALGAKVTLAGLVGEDQEAQVLCSRL